MTGDSSASVFKIGRIIIAIREHIASEDAQVGGGVGVGVDKAAELGVVVAGLEVIEPGGSNRKCAKRPFKRPFRQAFSAPQMGGKFFDFSTHQGHTFF